MPPKPNLGKYAYFAWPYSQREDSREVFHAVLSATESAGFWSAHPSLQIARSFDFDVDPAERARSEIAGASVLIAEVTDANPNVMLQVGFAQSAGIPTILLSQDSGSVPFLLRSSRLVTYQPGSSPSYITARLTDALASTMMSPRGTSATPAANRRRKAFFSYSHADAAYLDRILIHLRPLERSGLISLWSDTKLRAGDRWQEEIRRAVDEARVAVVLVSADFLASEFIVTNELPPLLMAAEKEGARIIPVIVKPSRFTRDATLSRFQAVNDPRRSLLQASEAEREEVYALLAAQIEQDVSP